MFEKAIKIARNFTFSVLESSVIVDKSEHQQIKDKVKVVSQNGHSTAILLNEHGDFLTCAHVFQKINKIQDNPDIMQIFQRHLDIIKSGSNEDDLIALYEQTPNEYLLCCNLYMPYFNDEIDILSIVTKPSVDLALFRLKNMHDFSLMKYPVFSTQEIADSIGMGVCIVGYPFSKSTGRYNMEEGKYQYNLQCDYKTLYPDFGFLAALRIYQKTKNSTFPYVGEFAEISCPGFTGQSGGPIIDVEGQVHGILSHADSPYHGRPEIMTEADEGSKAVFHRIVNHLGRGPSVKEILKFLKKNKVKFLKTT